MQLGFVVFAITFELVI